MKYFIAVENGTPVGSVFNEDYKSNTKNKLPLNFEEVVFVAAPHLGPYEKNQTLSFERNEDEKLTYVWSCESMSEEEITQKQTMIKNIWAENLTEGYEPWVFDSATCSFVEPA